MRLAVIALVIGSLLPACGGGTPSPKDESEANEESAPPAASAEATGDDTAAPESSAAPAASAAPPPAPPKEEIKPPVDDVWSVAHQMTDKDVSKGTKVAAAKVQKCFKDGLKRDKTTSGEVKIRFVIANAGTVKVWKDDGSSMSDGEVTNCIGALVQKMKFPKQKSPGDAWGSYTIKFGK